MATSRTTLGEKATNAKLLLSNLTIIFRQVRNGEHNFTSGGMKVFEDGLVHLGCEIEEVFRDLSKLIDENVDTLEKAAELLLKLAPAVELEPRDAIEIGELADGAKSARQRGPVYQPSENAPREFLTDMARPSIGDGSLKSVPPSNVVLFTGVRRERGETSGGAPT